MKSRWQEPKGAWFPLGKTEILACRHADYVNIGDSIDDAPVKLASLDADFHDRVLRIHERWFRPWLVQVNRESCGFGI